jgi:hypothetical protein
MRIHPRPDSRPFAVRLLFVPFACFVVNALRGERPCGGCMAGTAASQRTGVLTAGPLTNPRRRQRSGRSPSKLTANRS